jgi:hypothetical protein
VLALFLWRRLSKLQSVQAVVLGSERRDLLDFAVSLQGRIDDLYRAVDEVAAGLSRVDRRVDGSVTNTAVVRYDAYEGTGGQQSASLALLDATRTGTVVTAIQGRDCAHLRQGPRPRAIVVALPRRSGGSGARDGALNSLRSLFEGVLGRRLPAATRRSASSPGR